MFLNTGTRKKRMFWKEIKRFNPSEVTVNMIQNFEAAVLSNGCFRPEMRSFTSSSSKNKQWNHAFFFHGGTGILKPLASCAALICLAITSCLRCNLFITKNKHQICLTNNLLLLVAHVYTKTA